jgi:hypothetical protein
MSDNLYKEVSEIPDWQKSLKAIGCKPTWSTFEKTYHWYCIKQRLTPDEQDQYCEKWLSIYNNKKKRPN